MNRQHLSATSTVVIALLLVGVSIASAQTAPSLGTAGAFAVLAGSTVVNTGSSVITGDVGVSPGSAVVGFPPGTVVSGTIHAADATALQAQSDNVVAYGSLAGQSCTQDLSGQNLGGLVLTTGTYCYSSSAQLTGSLTLDAGGNPAAVFIIRTGSSLTTASGSAVSLINAASPCNVFWQVGSSATLGTSSSFAGNILALTSITLNTGGTLAGRTLAQNGAVTLDGNTVTAACATPTAITLSPAVLPAGTTAVVYNQTLTASGGTAPYTFTISAGTLPAGLSLSAAGVLSGTPTAAGVSAVTLRATDSTSTFTQRNYTITMLAAVPTLPQIAVVLLAVGLVAAGYLRLRRRT